MAGLSSNPQEGASRSWVMKLAAFTTFLVTMFPQAALGDEALDECRQNLHGARVQLQRVLADAIENAALAAGANEGEASYLRQTIAAATKAAILRHCVGVTDEAGCVLDAARQDPKEPRPEGGEPRTTSECETDRANFKESAPIFYDMAARLAAQARAASKSAVDAKSGAAVPHRP